jgi:hypothetical protein
VSAHLLGEILRNHQTAIDNPVNNLIDADNLRVLVWTNSKCGTTSLSRSFQRCIDGTTDLKNVVHCHNVSCWYAHYPSFSSQLKSVRFSFDMLIEFINSVGIKPLVVQSFRNPYDMLKSHAYACGVSINQSYIRNAYGPVDLSIPGLYNCEFDKINGFSYQSEDRYDILYTTVESLSNLAQNIQTIDSLSEYHGLTIEKNNIANSKSQEDYDVFKKSCKLSSEDIDSIHMKFKTQIEFYYTTDQFNHMKNDAMNH